MNITRFTLGARSGGPIPEYRATGKVAQVYHEIRQSLRVPGVNLLFRRWASNEKFIVEAWKQLRQNVETRVFDQAADQLRNSAQESVKNLYPPTSWDPAQFGQSRAVQIQAALELYSYINPKLLLITSAVRHALEGELPTLSPGQGSLEKTQRGVPETMFPLEMEEEKPGDDQLRKLFRDIQKTLSLPHLNSDYRTLGLWPDFLKLAWDRLKPLVKTPEFLEASSTLQQQAARAAGQLPFRMSLSAGRLRELGEDPAALLEITRSFERLLPGLILQIAILRQDSTDQDSEIAVPSGLTPPLTGDLHPNLGWRGFQRRQRLLRLDSEFMSFVDEGQGDAVVLLHGIPTWGFLWEQVLAGLSAQYRVIVPDLMGYGYSDKRDSFDRSLARQTDWVVKLLSKLNLKDVHVVGHDIGGGVALRLATLHSYLVKSLCVMNSVCYDSWPVEMMLQLGHPSAVATTSPGSMLKVLSKGLRMGFHSSPDAGWLEGLLSPWRTEVGRLSLVRNAVSLNTNHTTEITRLLHTIQAPTLVLWGEDDPFQPVHYGERLAEDIPGAALSRIPQARHFVMIDQPARVQQHLHHFLGQQQRPSGPAAAVHPSHEGRAMRVES
jgi:pimeloyl-ACP methyl ester carboxylesterase